MNLLQTTLLHELDFPLKQPPTLQFRRNFLDLFNTAINSSKVSEILSHYLISTSLIILQRKQRRKKRGKGGEMERMGEEGNMM